MNTIILIIFATMISTTLGGLLAIKLKDQLHLILGFSAGAVLGVALFDLIPESIELTKGHYDLRLVTILIAVGFCTYMLIDRLFMPHEIERSDCVGDDCHNSSHGSKLGVFALVFHSMLDGIGIGLAFKISPSIGWVVALAVLAHDFSDGINTVSMVIRRKGGVKSALRWLVADALAPVVGVILAYFWNVSEANLGLLLSVFVGLFLYISASDLVPESHHHHPTVWTSISTIIGMMVIFIAVGFAG